MRQFFDFVLYILECIVELFMYVELGGYSFGIFLVATSVISVLIGTLVISFKGSGGSPGSIVRPPRSKH